MQTAINQENIGRLNSLPGEPTSSPASPRDEVARGAGIVQHAPSHVKGYQLLDRAPCRGIERETNRDIKQLGVARVPIHSRVTKDKTNPQGLQVWDCSRANPNTKRTLRLTLSFICSRSVTFNLLPL